MNNPKFYLRKVNYITLNKCLVKAQIFMFLIKSSKFVLMRDTKIYGIKEKSSTLYLTNVLIQNSFQWATPSKYEWNVHNQHHENIYCFSYIQKNVAVQ